MRKLSFLSLCFIALFATSSCTKESVPQNLSTGPAATEPPSSYVVAYSEWQADADLSWSDGPSDLSPSRRAEISASVLTQQAYDNGSIVLVFAKSTAGNVVVPMPAVKIGSAGEVDSYEAQPMEGIIAITRTKAVNGVYEMPADDQAFSFRYLVITPAVTDLNARMATISDFSAYSYEEVADLFKIPR